MVSIAQSTGGMCGDGMTTLNEYERKAHADFVKDNFGSYELDREREMAEMRKGLTEEKAEKLDAILPSWPGNHPKELTDIEDMKVAIEQIRSKHSEDIKNLRDMIAAQANTIAAQANTLANLEHRINELESKPGFFGKVGLNFKKLFSN